MNDIVDRARLPFNTFRFVRNEQAIEFNSTLPRVTCALTDYTCTKVDRPDSRPARCAVSMVRFEDRMSPPCETPRRSPDGKLEALVQNYNLAVRDLGTQKVLHLSTDGSRATL